MFPQLSLCHQPRYHGILPANSTVTQSCSPGENRGPSSCCCPGEATLAKESLTQVTGAITAPTEVLSQIFFIGMHNSTGSSDLLQSQKSLRNCISGMITALMLKPSATIKNRQLCQCFYRKGWAKTRTTKSGLIQQQPGLIQAERQHASSCRHQGRFILQNWKCIFRIEPGKCRFRRRSSMPWQDHYGICRAPSNTGVSRGDFMLNLPEDQAHPAGVTSPAQLGWKGLIPSLYHAAQGHTRHLWAAPTQWSSQQRNQSTLVSSAKATATSLSTLLPSCQHPVLPHFCFEEKKKKPTKGLY